MPDPETRHDAYVRTGHCASVNESGAWCNGRAGHAGRRHWAHYLLNRAGDTAIVEWD